ncbi:MAG TPA: hypothetical protein VNQ32_03100 [Steroidobacteraceae bacterium]|nr:hypothetical protein [Steroidobacteraceae bacterium]
MSRSTCQLVREWLLARLRALPELWHEDLPGLPEAAQGMQIPLRPSAVIHKGRWLLHLLPGFHLVQLTLLGHVLVAGIVALLTAALVWQCRAAQPATMQSRRLFVSAHGRMHLLGAGGIVAPAVLQPCSMRLGPWLLLVLREGTGTRRLLLGPDNVDPAQLAALRRRVAAIPHRSRRVTGPSSP